VEKYIDITDDVNLKMPDLSGRVLVYCVYYYRLADRVYVSTYGVCLLQPYWQYACFSIPDGVSVAGPLPVCMYAILCKEILVTSKLKDRNPAP